jgi:hypothetical protein
MSINFSAALEADPGVSGEFKEAMGLEPAPSLVKYDLEAVKSKITTLAEGTDAMVSRIKALVVNTDEANEEATSLGAGAAKLIRRLETTRKEEIAEASGFVDGVNATVKVFVERLKTVKDLAGTKTTQYEAFQRQKKEEEDRKARQAAADLQAELDRKAAEQTRKLQEEADAKAREETAKKQAEADALAKSKAALNGTMFEDAKAAPVEEVKAAPVDPVKPVQVVTPVTPPKPTVTRTEQGSRHTRSVWNFKIVDVQAVPRPYLVVSDTLIRNAIRDGIRAIEGVEIFEETRAVFK